jgi:hypothetical protein
VRRSFIALSQLPETVACTVACPGTGFQAGLSRRTSARNRGTRATNGVGWPGTSTLGRKMRVWAGKPKSRSEGRETGCLPEETLRNRPCNEPS